MEGEVGLGGHLAALGQHFLAVGAHEEEEEEQEKVKEEVSKNTTSNYGEGDAAPPEEVVDGIRCGDGDGDRDVTSDFVAPDNNNIAVYDECRAAEAGEGEDNKFAFGLEGDHGHGGCSGGGCGSDRGREGGWGDCRLTALRLARARLRGEQQATLDGRCGGGGGNGGDCGGGGKEGGQQQIWIGSGDGEEDGDEDDFTEGRDDDDEEEIGADDTLTCHSNQQVRSRGQWDCFLVLRSRTRFSLTQIHTICAHSTQRIPFFAFFGSWVQWNDSSVHVDCHHFRAVFHGTSPVSSGRSRRRRPSPAREASSATSPAAARAAWARWGSPPPSRCPTTTRAASATTTRTTPQPPTRTTPTSTRPPTTLPTCPTRTCCRPLRRPTRRRRRTTRGWTRRRRRLPPRPLLLPEEG